MAESAYDELSRRLNYQIPKPIPLIFYVTHAEFEQNNIILNFIPEGVGAFAEPARNRMVLPIDLPDEKLQALIQHELTHIFQYEILFGGRLGRALTSNAPTWFMEGMASYFGNDEDEKDRMFVRDAVNSDLIPPDHARPDRGLSRLPVRARLLRLPRGRVGQGRPARFRLRVPLLPRAGRLAGPPPDLRRHPGRLRPEVPPLPPAKVPAAPRAEGGGLGVRPAVPDAGSDSSSYEVGTAASPSGDFVATLTTDKDARRHRPPLGPGAEALQEPLGRADDEVRVHRRPVPDDRPRGRARPLLRPRRRPDRRLRPARAGAASSSSSRSGRAASSSGSRSPPDQPLSPAFSPDGKTVAFAGTAERQAGHLPPRPRDEVGPEPVGRRAYDEAPVFSPDGKFVYHVEDRRRASRRSSASPWTTRRRSSR